jgi:potassium-transporting ATPase KdpC subunit
MNRLPHWLAQNVAAIRVVLVLTLVTGLAYPLLLFAAGQIPGLRHQAEGSPLTGPGGRDVGSALIGQPFTGAAGRPLVQYFQPRPSNAGDGYDPTASGAGNQGPESIVDTPDRPSLLTQVCARSRAVGALEGVDGGRPYCTSDGTGAVLGVFRTHGTAGAVTRVVSLDQPCPDRPFLATYQGARVECARPGAEYGKAVVVPVRGGAPAHPPVPADAVTASGSGLDPQISPAYARLQIPRVARERGTTEARIRALVAGCTTGRALGVFGEPGVNVVELNLALDRAYPYRPTNRPQGA